MSAPLYKDATITTQPKYDPIVPLVTGPVPGAKGNGTVTVRNLDPTSKEDREFAGNMLIEGFRSKVVHATSEQSLPKLKANITLDLENQESLYYQCFFVAECEGKRAGVMGLKFHNTPELRANDDNYRDLGCCNLCGLFCITVTIGQEKAPQGYCYVDHVVVDEEFRGKGIGKVLLDRADYEAKKNGCTKIYLDVMTSNRAQNLYRREGYDAKYTRRLCGLLWCIAGERSMIRMEKNL